MTEAAFLLFVFLKQFYARRSGSIGLADCCLALSAASLMWDMARGKRPAPSIFTIKKERYFLYFLGFVVGINMIFSIIDRNLEYETYTLYWIFNAMGMWCFTELANKQFLEKLNKVCKFNIIMQIIVWIFGYGRIFIESWGGIRYTGTFNDPNQYAFFLFCMILLISLYGCNYGDWTAPVYYCLGVFFMSTSKSTGVFFGTILYTVGIVIWFYLKYRREGKISPKAERVMAVILVLVGISVITWLIPTRDFNIENTDYTIISRIQEKIWKVLYGGNSTMLSDRGLDRMILYPFYLIFGSGEGNFGRFIKATQQNEIHCSLLNIWFCYGVIPTVLLLKWLKCKLKNLTAAEWIIVGSLIIESFSLVNYRQPFFWMILLYSYVRQNSQEKPTLSLPFHKLNDIL